MPRLTCLFKSVGSCTEPDISRPTKLTSWHGVRSLRLAAGSAARVDRLAPALSYVNLPPPSLSLARSASIESFVKSEGGGGGADWRRWETEDRPMRAVTCLKGIKQTCAGRTRTLTDSLCLINQHFNYCRSLLVPHPDAWWLVGRISVNSGERQVQRIW